MLLFCKLLMDYDSYLEAQTPETGLQQIHETLY
jgi:hypothetical protein